MVGFNLERRNEIRVQIYAIDCHGIRVDCKIDWSSVKGSPWSKKRFSLRGCTPLAGQYPLGLVRCKAKPFFRSSFFIPTRKLNVEKNLVIPFFVFSIVITQCNLLSFVEIIFNNKILIFPKEYIKSICEIEKRSYFNFAWNAHNSIIREVWVSTILLLFHIQNFIRKSRTI